MGTEYPKWCFPRAYGSRSQGFKEAGVATFGGKIMGSLVREICQNSLDAAASDGKPVRVEFEKYQIAPEQVPGHRQLYDAFGASVRYWSSRGNTETVRHLLRARELLGETKPLAVLRASDFGTTGLHAAYEDRIDDWTRLTKIDGGATKSDDSAGSYGIGKNAPFAASELRTVFYRTLTDEAMHGGRAAQGIVHLPAYAEDPQKEVTTLTLGVGYYGAPSTSSGIINGPVPSIQLLNELCRREEIGTDVFVFGLYEEAHWRDVVAAEVLESFLLAVHDGQLEVFLRDGGESLAITRGTLPEVVARFKGKAKNAASYFRILEQPDAVKTIERDFHGLGTLRLRLLADADSSLNRKVLVTRANKMRIRHYDRISRSMKFTGILELAGARLNRYFRAMETPAHDGWEPERYTQNTKQAKMYLRELRDWVVRMVTETAALTTEDQVRVSGLSSSLRTGSGVGVQNQGASERSDEPGREQQVEISVRPEPAARRRQENAFVQRTGAEVAEDGKDAALGGSGASQLPRTRRKKTPRGNGQASSGSSQIEPARTGGSSPRAIPVQFARLVQTGPRAGRLILKVAQPAQKGSIRIRIVGENGRQYGELGVGDVWANPAQTVMYASDSRIRFEDLPENEKVVADVVFDDPISYAVGVFVYEDW